jgi:hypothetical protein
VLVDDDPGRAFWLWRHEAAELLAAEEWRYG